MNFKAYIERIILSDPRIGRRKSFLYTMQEVEKRWPEGKINIVETGTTRKKKDEDVSCDGGSTILWGEYALFNQESRVWTCDISEANITECKRWTWEYRHFIEYVVDDSINFLTKFDKPIHLLYLDSYDSSHHDRAIIEAACNHQLREINVIYNNLREDSLILLDDIRPDLKGGKSEYTIPFLQGQGWKIISHVAEQVLLSK